VKNITKMKLTFNLDEFLNEPIKKRINQLNISQDEFWNMAGQNLLNMSKEGLPTANDIINFKLDAK